MSVRFDYTGIAVDDAVRRDVAVYIAVGRNQHVVADRDFPDYRGIDADPHAISYRGRAFAFTPVFLSYGHAFMYVAILSYFGIGIDCDSVRMANV